MHILFLTDNFPPEFNAPASRTFEHAREWTKLGHQVTIITCAPNFPEGKLFKGYKNKLWQSEDLDGIRVIRVWSYMTANEGFTLRILDYISFMFSSFLASLFVRKPDVIVGTSPQFFTVVAAWAASAIKGKPFMFELRDIWPESIREVGAMQAGGVLDFLEKVELFLYSRAAAVVSVTHSFKQNLIARGVEPDKIHVITNGVDSSCFKPMRKNSTLASKLDVEGCLVAGYVGTHGMAHGLDTLLDAAKILQDDKKTQHIRILFVGHGAVRKNLIDRARDMGLENVIFHTAVPRDILPAYWSLIDVAIIPLRRTKLFKTVIPSKIFECMGMGIPIILGVEGEAAEIIHDTGVGITIEPENHLQLADHLKLLSSKPELLREMSAAGVESAPLYDRTVLARSMLSILKKL